MRVRNVSIACIAGLALFANVAAHALTDEELKAKIEAANPRKSQDEKGQIFACHKYKAEICRELDPNFTGLKPEQVASFLKKNMPFFAAQARDYPSVRVAPPPTRQVDKEPVDRDAQKISSYFLVRRSLEDISTLTLPRKVEDVAGAIFSYSRDNVISNAAWSARGVVAVPFYIEAANAPLDPLAIGHRYVVAPFVAFDKLTNSSAGSVKSNLNNLTLGVISETAITNVGKHYPVSHYVRLNSGANTDFDGNLKSWYLRGEWEPFSTALGLNAPIDFLAATGFAVSPLIKLRAEYVGKVGSIDQPIFVSRDDAFRAGSRLGLEIQPVTLWPNWFKKFTLVAAYGYLYDTFSSRSYSLFDSSLNYNIDEAGNYAVSANYRRGRLEETGDKVDQYMVGLAVKLNYLPDFSRSTAQ
jgi:hypothetical protein